MNKKFAGFAARYNYTQRFLHPAVCGCTIELLGGASTCGVAVPAAAH